MKRLWGIRHVRYLWHSTWEQGWATEWYRSGRYSSPGEYLDAIWRGDV
jgi:hypothetical protein